MTSDDQWHRIRFPQGELASGAIGRFFMDILLPATEEQAVDLSTVAIEVDDSKGGKYLYLSPNASSAFLTLALAHHGLAILQVSKACLASTASSGRPGSSSYADARGPDTMPKRFCWLTGPLRCRSVI